MVKAKLLTSEMYISFDNQKHSFSYVCEAGKDIQGDMTTACRQTATYEMPNWTILDQQYVRLLCPECYDKLKESEENNER